MESHTVSAADAYLNIPRHKLAKRLKDPRKVPVVLLACGSFSPVTFLHLRLFEMARDYLHGTGQFEVLGGYMSPVSDKYGKADLAPAHHRVRMCELALENGANDWVTVDAWEAMLDHHSPTARVMERFSAALNVDGGVPTINAEGVEERRPIRVMLLAGTDLIKSMQVPGLWEPDDIRRIVGDFGCVVVERAGTDLMDIILEHDILYEHRAHIFMVRQIVQNDVSSTKIRLMLKRGMSVKYLLPDLVISYIYEAGLYGTKVVSPLSTRISSPLSLPNF